MIEPLKFRVPDQPMTADVGLSILKINELVGAYNELERKYEDHNHVYDSETSSMSGPYSG